MSIRTLPAFFSVCFALMAQESSGTAILRHAAQAYTHLRSESVEATVFMDMKTHRIEFPIVGAIVRPDKFHFEVVNSLMGSHTISDGHNIWKYVASFQQYTKMPVSPGIIPLEEGPRDILAGERVLDRLRSAVRLRREKLFVDGKQVDCDVIEATYEPDESGNPGKDTRKTFWVDVHRGVILKVSSLIRMDSPETGGAREIAQSVTVTSIKLNVPLRDSLFVFVAPEGAKEVAQLVPPRRAPEVGEQPERE